MKVFLRFFFTLVALVVVVGLTAFLVMRGVLKEEEVVVPNLIGLDVVTALDMVGERSLNLRIVGREYSDSMGENFILSQDPQPQKLVKKARNVRVVLAKGSKQVLVPDLRGKTLRQAENLLRGVDLLENRVAYVHSAEYPEHVVASHNPEPSVRVERETGVDLLVSLGKRNEGIYMPDLIGKDVGAAGKVLEGLDLKLGKITYEQYEDFPSEIVIRQAPLFGYQVEKGEQIDLVLSRPVVPDEEQGDTYSYLDYTVPVGDDPRMVRIFVETATSRAQVFEGMEEPGSVVSLLVRVEGDTVARIYLDDKLVEERRFR